MKHFVQRYTKEKIKKILWKASPLFCIPLSREDTRELDFLEQTFKTRSFELKTLSVNGIKTKLPVEVYYSDSILFRATSLENQNLRILPSGGICSNNRVLCTGFEGQQAFNIFKYLQSFVKRKQSIAGTIICNWPHQFLTYGDFVLQLLPELCLIKSIISEEEWLNANFVFYKPPKFLVGYLKILDCDEGQIIDSSNCCFDVAPKSKIYFREKDKMWFLCAPFELLQISRNYLMAEQDVNYQSGKMLFVERLGGYRRAIGLDEKMRSKLRELGVSFFDPSNVSIKEQIEAFANARIVIGIHGAGIANILWCKQGTKVVEIFHPKFAPWCYAILANQLDLDYYSLGRDPGSQDINFRETDVDVDWNCLIELIKRFKNDIA